MSKDELNYDGLMQANLSRIFGEADVHARGRAIAEIYAPDAVLYEPDHIATGHAEIIETIDKLMKSFPPGFGFAAEGAAIGHHGLGRLRWSGGVPGSPKAVTGTDVVRFEGDRIKTIHVFIDPPAA
ncbi:hypothetical protein BH10PSE4_BH10PSE4_43860 [soil metagenome]